MDIRSSTSYSFEWDAAKAAASRAKHGASFEEAREAFRDLFGVDSVDDSMDYDEPRYSLIGRAGPALLFVIYTERGETIRIISARRATRQERAFYHEQNAQT